MDPDALLADTRHRPWPLPSDPWIMRQSWVDLLFIHWPIPLDRLRPLVPPPLEIETRDGSAWLGLTPFVLEGLQARFLPPVPGASSFPELNLRTYVRMGDRPGIFFFTLEAGSRLAVAGARAFYRLPYRSARMEVRREDGWIRYRSTREDGTARLEASYRPTGPGTQPAPGSLEHFLTERYALYATLRRGGALRAEVHHSPWTLQPAEAEIRVNTVPAAHGIELPDSPPLLHFGGRQDTLVWAPKVVA